VVRDGEVLAFLALPIGGIPDYAITDLGLIDCVSLQAISPLL
jgi:adenine deaminase